mgnify:CR=1 FL=1
MRRLVFSVLTAGALWFVMFSPWTAGWLNFWWSMAASACVLLLLAGSGVESRRPRVKCQVSRVKSQEPNGFRRVLDVLLEGAAIAAVLWGVFWVGDKLSTLWFDFARPQVDLIYEMKSGNNPWVIGGLLLLVIGPAEEIFWRGYVQRSLVSLLAGVGHTDVWARNMAFVVTVCCYTLIHLPSLNFMFIMAALVCGMSWGLLYRLMPSHLPAIVVSHAIWDAAVFVVFPI